MSNSSSLDLPQNPTLRDIQQYVAHMEQERGFTKDEVSAKCILLAEEVA
jgi:hypothetical protein